MKNQKIVNIPNLLQNNEIIDDPKVKSNIFNDLFASKANVPGKDDPIPILPEKDNIHSNFNVINTSRIEVAKLCRDIKKSNSSYCGVNFLP